MRQPVTQERGIPATFHRPVRGNVVLGAPGPVPPASCCDLILSGTYAARPAAGTDEQLYLPSDGVSWYRDNGAAWQAWAGLFGIFPMTPPPAVSTWTWVNQGTATADETHGGICIETPADAALSLRTLVRSVTAPYTVTAALLINGASTNTLYGGLVFRQSSDGKLVTFDLAGNAGRITVSNWTNETTWLSHSVNSAQTSFADHERLWWRIQDDNTNRVCSFSRDGRHWYEYYSTGRTTFLTADQVGVFASGNGSAAAQITLLSWEQT